MRKSILAILIIITSVSCAQAGEIYWLTDTGIKSRIDCVINQHSHNDNSHIHEFWIDCDDNVINPIQNRSVVGNSTVYFEGIPMLTCKMGASTFGRNDVFYMLLDCRENIPVFENNFEQSS